MPRISCLILIYKKLLRFTDTCFITITLIHKNLILVLRGGECSGVGHGLLLLCVVTSSLLLLPPGLVWSNSRAWVAHGSGHPACRFSSAEGLYQSAHLPDCSPPTGDHRVEKGLLQVLIARLCGYYKTASGKSKELGGT